MTGSLEILNVGSGDIRLTFNTKDAADAIRARRMITDMLRRGYALLIEVERIGETKLERVQAFDEQRGEYIIADFDPHVAEVEDAFEEACVTRERKEGAERSQSNGPSTVLREHAGSGRSDVEGRAPDGPATGLDEGPLIKPKRGRPAKRKIPMEKARATAVGRSAGG